MSFSINFMTGHISNRPLLIPNPVDYKLCVIVHTTTNYEKWTE